MAQIKVKPKPFFYDGQFHRYVRQIMAAFSGFQVVSGKQRDGEVRYIGVPVIFGGRDRLSHWIQSGASQNSMIPLPVISIRPVSLQQDATLRRAPYHTRLQSYVDRNLTPGEEANAESLMRDDIRPDLQKRELTVEMWMPVPYKFQFEVTVMASNMDQGMQIVEQIGTLYNPELDLKVSDSPLDWTFLTNMIFEGDIQFGRQAADLGAGTREAPHTFTMRFGTTMHWSPPAMVYKSQLIEEIHLQIKEMTAQAVDSTLNWEELEELDHLVIRSDDIENEPDDE